MISLKPHPWFSATLPSLEPSVAAWMQEASFLLDPSAANILWQDGAGTVPAVQDRDPVRLIQDARNLRDAPLLDGSAGQMVIEAGHWVHHSGGTATAQNGIWSVDAAATYQRADLLTIGMQYEVSFDWTRSQDSAVPAVGDAQGMHIAVTAGDGALSGHARGIIRAGGTAAALLHLGGEGSVTVANLHVAALSHPALEATHPTLSPILRHAAGRSWIETDGGEGTASIPGLFGESVNSDRFCLGVAVRILETPDKLVRPWGLYDGDAQKSSFLPAADGTLRFIGATQNSGAGLSLMQDVDHRRISTRDGDIVGDWIDGTANIGPEQVSENIRPTRGDLFLGGPRTLTHTAARVYGAFVLPDVPDATTRTEMDGWLNDRLPA